MTLDGTWTYLVGRDQVAIIDPGPSDRRHSAAIESAISGAIPIAIILTHLHADHSEAAPELARRTGAPVLAGTGAFRQLADVRTLEDGEAIRVDEGRLVMMATPGHAPEHITPLWYAAAGDRKPAFGFAGDLLMGEGDTTLLAPPEGDVAAYFRSLDRLEAAEPRALLPAHGPPILHPAEAIQRHRRHREDRVEQLKALLVDRPEADPAELLDRLYGASLNPRLRRAAVGSIETMMEFLRRPGADS